MQIIISFFFKKCRKISKNSIENTGILIYANNNATSYLLYSLICASYSQPCQERSMICIIVHELYVACTLERVFLCKNKIFPDNYVDDETERNQIKQLLSFPRQWSFILKYIPDYLYFLNFKFVYFLYQYKCIF